MTHKPTERTEFTRRVQEFFTSPKVCDYCGEYKKIANCVTLGFGVKYQCQSCLDKQNKTRASREGSGRLMDA